MRYNNTIKTILCSTTENCCQIWTTSVCTYYQWRLFCKNCMFRIEPSCPVDRMPYCMTREQAFPIRTHFSEDMEQPTIWRLQRNWYMKSDIHRFQTNNHVSNMQDAEILMTASVFKWYSARWFIGKWIALVNFHCRSAVYFLCLYRLGSWVCSDVELNMRLCFL
jgi:hypothetical protein